MYIYTIYIYIYIYIYIHTYICIHLESNSSVVHFSTSTLSSLTENSMVFFSTNPMKTPKTNNAFCNLRCPYQSVVDS